MPRTATRRSVGDIDMLLPGIIVDPVIASRELPTRKRGVLTIPNSVVVASLRTPPGQEPFYTSRPEAHQFVIARAERFSFIDGPQGTPLDQAPGRPR